MEEEITKPTKKTNRVAAAKKVQEHKKKAKEQMFADIAEAKANAEAALKSVNDPEFRQTNQRRITR